MEQTECSETSAYKIQAPGNYPEENIKQNTRSSKGKDGGKWGKGSIDPLFLNLYTKWR
jgi:hypothetical protein